MKNFYLLLLFTGIVNAQVVPITDANFKAKLLAANTTNHIAEDVNGASITIDKSGNGQIEQVEALAVYELKVDNADIASLTGIQSFTNLNYLSCENNNLTTLDLTGLINLTDINCFENDIADLNITGLTNLIALDCHGNKITNLNVTGFTNLNILYCQSNQLTALNVSGLTNLENLNCSENRIPALNCTGLTNLIVLDCSENPITTLTLSGLDDLIALICGNPLLTSLHLSGLNSFDSLSVSGALTSLDLHNVPTLTYLAVEETSLTTLDLSVLPNLIGVYFQKNNALTTINLQNGSREQSCNILSNPNLTSVCTDVAEVSILQTYFNTTGQTGVTVNSNCSLGTPDIIAASSVKIYPNPTTGIIHITAANHLKLAQIYDLQGRLLQTNTVNASTAAIDISARTAGIYLLKVQTANGVRMEKIIKQ